MQINYHQATNNTWQLAGLSDSDLSAPVTESVKAKPESSTPAPSSLLSTFPTMSPDTPFSGSSDPVPGKTVLFLERLFCISDLDRVLFQLIVEFEYPPGAGSSSRKNLFAPYSLFSLTADAKSRLEDVERLKNFIIANETSLQRVSRSDLSFFIYQNRSSARPTSGISENSSLSAQPVVLLDENSLSQLAQQSVLHIKIAMKSKVVVRPSHEIPAVTEPAKVQQNSQMEMRSVKRGSLTLAESASSAIFSSVSNTSAKSEDSSISKWDANPLRNKTKQPLDGIQ